MPSQNERRADTMTPDVHADGFVEQSVGALRYDDIEAIDHELTPYEVAAMMRSKVSSGSKVLDVGCGTGSMTLQVTRGLNCDVLGVEPDPDRASLGQSRGLDIVCGMVDTALLEKRGPFDVIMLTDVLEHLSAPAEMLRMLSDALVPGGRVIASVPNVAHWTVRWNLLRGKFDYTDKGIMDSTHLRWFTRKSISLLFVRSGFHIISLEATAGVWIEEYLSRPLSLIPGPIRRGAIRQLTALTPGAFGAQHIVEAIRAKDAIESKKEPGR